MKTLEEHTKEIQDEFDCYNPVSSDTEPVVTRLAKLHHELDIQRAGMDLLKESMTIQISTNKEFVLMFNAIAKKLGIVHGE